MDTTRFQVFGLRGIDQRWFTDGTDALNIEDMFFTANDSWRTSGGFVQLYKYPYVKSTPEFDGLTILTGDWEIGVVESFDPSDPSASDFFDYGFGDGISDIIEGSGDSDDYGGIVMDAVAAFDVPPTERGDTDADGQFDYIDGDDDADGIVDVRDIGFSRFGGTSRTASDWETRRSLETYGDTGFTPANFANSDGLIRQFALAEAFDGVGRILTAGGGTNWGETPSNPVWRQLVKLAGWDFVDGTTGGEILTSTGYYGPMTDAESEVYRRAISAAQGTFNLYKTSGSTFLSDEYGDNWEIEIGSNVRFDGDDGTYAISPYTAGSVEWYTDDDGIPRPVGFYDADASDRVDLLPYGVDFTLSTSSGRPTLGIGSQALEGYFQVGKILKEGFRYEDDPFFSYMFPDSSSSTDTSGGGSDSSTDPSGSTYDYDLEDGETGDLTDFVDLDSVNPYSETEGSDVTDASLKEPSAYVNVSFEEINSLHWFCQHNGARQFLVYETKNSVYRDSSGVFEPTGECTLKVFDGSKAKADAESVLDLVPEKVLYEFKDPYGIGFGSAKKTRIRHRTASQLSVRSQSQCYGGRLYMANGFDEAIVFDGTSVEKAGFVDLPPAPSVKSSGAMNSMTIPVAVGDSSSDFSLKSDDDHKFPISKGFYGKHFPVQYFGLGSSSNAEIGVGRYRIRDEGDDAKINTDAEYTERIQMKIHYYGDPQHDTRKCGFQYKITYVNERGQESAPSMSSSLAIIENGSNSEKNRAAHGKGLVGVDIPLGPKECVARRIYRTRNLYSSAGNLYSVGDQQSFYFLDEIQDNMTTTYIDAKPDTSLGELLETRDLGNFPPGSKFLAVFKNTMFVAGSSLNEIKYSAPLFPEVFPEDNIINVGDDDGGQIMGMRATKNALIVFKQRGIYLVKGTPSSGFQSFTLNKDVGCIAPNSIAEVPGLGLMFLSESSIYLLEGALENTGTPTAVVEVGREIPEILETINKSAAIRSSATVYQKDKEYWLSVPTIGSSKNNLCLIYHYEIGSWSIRRHFPADCMITTQDHRGYLIMGSNDVQNESRAGLLVYTRGSNKKGSITLARTVTSYDDNLNPTELSFVSEEPIFTESLYETINVDYQSVFTNFRPAHVFAYNVGYGDLSLSVNTRVNRSIDLSRQRFQDAPQQDPNEHYPVYGSAFYDKDSWIAYRPIVTRFDVSTTHKGPVRELSVQFRSQPGEKFEIIGYDLEAKVGEHRNIKPLTTALRSSRR